MSYTPQPGTIPARVIAYLHEQARVGRAWVPSAEVSEHVGQPAVSPYMEAALNHGAVRKRAVAQNKRLSEYSFGDGTPLPAPADMEADMPLRVEPITPSPAQASPAPREALWKNRSARSSSLSPHAANPPKFGVTSTPASATVSSC